MSRPSCGIIPISQEERGLALLASLSPLVRLNELLRSPSVIIPISQAERVVPPPSVIIPIIQLKGLAFKLV